MNMTKIDFRKFLRRFVFLLAIFFVAGVISIQWIHNRQTAMIAKAFAEMAASHQARTDFNAGTLRLYELTRSDDFKNVSSKLRQEGLYEIVIWRDYPSYMFMSDRANTAFVEKYNAMMKYFVNDPAAAEDDGWAGQSIEDPEEVGKALDEDQPGR